MSRLFLPISLLLLSSALGHVVIGGREHQLHEEDFDFPGESDSHEKLPVAHPAPRKPPPRQSKKTYGDAASEAQNCSQVCRTNEVFKECGSHCRDRCIYHVQVPTICTQNCVKGCFCIEGHFRHPLTHECVRGDECPSPDAFDYRTNKFIPIYGKECVIIFEAPRLSSSCLESCNKSQKCNVTDVSFDCFCRDGFCRDGGGSCVPNDAPVEPPCDSDIDFLHPRNS